MSVVNSLVVRGKRVFYSPTFINTAAIGGGDESWRLSLTAPRSKRWTAERSTTFDGLGRPSYGKLSCIYYIHVFHSGQSFANNFSEIHYHAGNDLKNSPMSKWTLWEWASRIQNRSEFRLKSLGTRHSGELHHLQAERKSGLKIPFRWGKPRDILRRLQCDSLCPKIDAPKQSCE